MIEQLKFFIESERFDRYKIHIDARRRTGEMNGVAEPVVFRDLTREDMYKTDIPPALITSRDDMQSLFDSLYQKGFRYSHSDQHSQGKIDAVTSHLNDMRKIVSKKLNVELGD